MMGISPAIIDHYVDVPAPAPGGPYSAEVLADAPLAYYRLGEAPGGVFDDSSGYARTLTSSGAVVTMAPGPATLNGSIVLDGSSASLTSDYAPSALDAFTVEAWYKGTDTAGVIVSGRNGATRGLRLGIGADPLGGGANGRVHFGVSADSLWIGVYTTTVTVNDDAWHHIVGVWDRAGSSSVSAGQFTVYVDGSLATVGANTFGSSPAPLTLAAQIIGNEIGASNYLAGHLAAVACYPATLTSTRIGAHYAESGTSSAAYVTSVTADAPGAFWLLDDGPAALLDSSGNARNGGYVGPPTLGAAGLLGGSTDTAADFSAGKYAQTPFGIWMSAAAFTFEALVCPDSVSGELFIVSRHSSGNPGADLAIQAGKFRFRTYSGGWGDTYSTTIPVVGQTYHVVGSWDGTNRRIHVNGALEATTGGSYGSSNAPLAIGQLGDAYAGSPYNFDGRIDEVAYYGTALSSTRIAAHAAAA